MKVKINAGTKKWLTLEQAPAARKMIQELKEDTFSAKEYAAMAGLALFCNNSVEVLKADAEIAGNRVVWDAYGEGSGFLDVWITAIVKATDMFAEFGVYLTDIWNIGNDGNSGPEVFGDRAYVVRYKKI